jgi:hypothetical protein
MATKVEFASIMAYLGAAVGKEPTADQARVYFDLLGDLPMPVLEVAAKRALLGQTVPVLPLPGVIRQHAAAGAGPGVPLADAFAAVRAFAARWYPWLCDGLPTDPKTRARFDAHLASLPENARRAAEAYGWPALVTTEPGVSFAHFRQLYESVDGPARRDAALPPAARDVAAILNTIGRALPAAPEANGRG